MKRFHRLFIAIILAVGCACAPSQKLVKDEMPSIERKSKIDRIVISRENCQTLKAVLMEFTDSITGDTATFDVPLFYQESNFHVNHWGIRLAPVLVVPNASLQGRTLISEPSSSDRSMLLIRIADGNGEVLFYDFLVNDSSGWSAFQHENINIRFLSATEKPTKNMSSKSCAFLQSEETSAEFVYLGSKGKYVRRYANYKGSMYLYDFPPAGSQNVPTWREYSLVKRKEYDYLFASAISHTEPEARKAGLKALMLFRDPEKMEAAFSKRRANFPPLTAQKGNFTMPWVDSLESEAVRYVLSKTLEEDRNVEVRKQVIDLVHKNPWFKGVLSWPLHDVKQEVRLAAVRALEKGQDIEHIKLLGLAYISRDEMVRHEAERILGEIKSVELLESGLAVVPGKAREFLLELLMHAKGAYDEEVYAEEAYTEEKLLWIQETMGKGHRSKSNEAIRLAGTQGPTAVPLLIGALYDGSFRTVPCHAAQGLAKIGASRAVEPLLDVTFKEGQYFDQRVRVCLAKSLSNLAGPEIIPRIEKYLDNENSWIVMAALTVLLHFDDPRGLGEYERLIEKVDSVAEKIFAVREIANFHSAETVRILIKSLDDPDINFGVSRLLSKMVSDWQILRALNFQTRTEGVNFIKELGSNKTKWQNWWEKNRDIIIGIWE